MIIDSHLDWSHVHPLDADIFVSPIFSIVAMQEVAVYSLDTVVSLIDGSGYRKRAGHTNAFDGGNDERR